MTRVVIAGAGRYGEVIAEELRSAGFDPVAFLDDDVQLHGKRIGGLPVAGSTTDLNAVFRAGATQLVCAIGTNSVRRRVLSSARQAGIETPAFVHPSVGLPGTTQIAVGAIVFRGAQFMPFTTVGEDAIVSMGALVAHHSTISSGSFLSTGVCLGAGVEVAEEAFIGIGATIMTGVRRIGVRSTVGAGSVVIADVADDAVVAGVPARPLRKRT